MPLFSNALLQPTSPVRLLDPIAPSRFAQRDSLARRFAPAMPVSWDEDEEEDEELLDDDDDDLDLDDDDEDVFDDEDEDDLEEDEEEEVEP
jgi:hypothetical protein